MERNTSFQIDFDELFKQAIEGKTSISYCNRGNHLVKFKNKYNRLLKGCETKINRTIVPYTLIVSWENRFAEIKSMFDNLFEELKADKRLGPYNIVDVCHQIVDDRNLDLEHLSSTERYTILLFSANIAFDYCKIRIKGPFGSIIKAIKRIDDNSSFFYFDHDEAVDNWSDSRKMGKYSYISDKRIAMLLRISYGFEFEDLTEIEKSV